MSPVPSGDRRKERARKLKILNLADALAKEAQSYVDYGHSLGDEDRPLQEAIDAYVKARKGPSR